MFDKSHEKPESDEDENENEFEQEQLAEDKKDEEKLPEHEIFQGHLNETERSELYDLDQKPSFFQRVKDYAKSTRIYNGAASVGGYLAEKGKKAVEKVTSHPWFTKAKNAIKGATAGAPLLSIAMYSLTIAGVMSPFGPAVALTVGVIGLTGVAVGAVMDTIKTRGLRRLGKEHKELNNFVDVKRQQNQMLSDNPRLSSVLGLKKNFDASPAVHTGQYKQSIFGKIKSFAWSAVRNAADVAVAITQVSVVSAANFVRKIATAVVFVAIDSSHNVKVGDKIVEYKEKIAAAKDKYGLLEYKGLDDLKDKVREERITLGALEIMETKVKKNPDLTDEQIRKGFEEAREQSEKILDAMENSSKSLAGRAAYAMKSLGEDFLQAHNPFSVYHNPHELEIKDVGVENKTTPVRIPKSTAESVEGDSRAVKQVASDLNSKVMHEAKGQIYPPKSEKQETSVLAKKVPGTKEPQR